MIHLANAMASLEGESLLCSLKVHSLLKKRASR